MADNKRIVRALLDRAGQTYAEQAGIKLADKPAPQFGTPRKMLDVTWQQRVDALGRAHYVRYDESTATALGEGARLLLDKYGGDLRKLRGDGLRKRLREVPRLGPVGVDIFCREVPERLAKLTPDVPRLAAALIRVSLDRTLADQVRAA